ARKFTTYSDMDLSRRTYDATVATTPANLPTDFANPFRSASGAGMVPPLQARNLLHDKDVNVTLMSAGRSLNAATGKYWAASDTVPPGVPNFPDNNPNALPLFGDRTTVDTTTPVTIPATSPNPPMYTDGNRNSYFRYQGLDRLGNLVTTHSNVYAVWVTV